METFWTAAAHSNSTFPLANVNPWAAHPVIVTWVMQVSVHSVALLKDRFGQPHALKHVCPDASLAQPPTDTLSSPQTFYNTVEGDLKHMVNSL